MGIQRPGARARRIVQVIIITACLLSSVYIVFTDSGHSGNWKILVGRGIDVLAIVVSVILFVSLITNRTRTATDERYMMFIVSEAALLTIDIISWMFNGDPGQATLNLLSRYAKNLGLIAISLFFWEFLTRYLNFDPRRRRAMWWLMGGFVVATLVLFIINPFTGILFDVDDEGRYVRGSCLFLFYTMGLFPPMVASFLVVKYHSGFREKFAAMSYLAVEVVLLILQYFNEGISLVYVGPLITAVIIYANFYVTENERLLKRESEIKKERYEAMITQLQPHFLYNSLTSIMNIKGMPDEGKDAICDFAKYLRENISSMDKTYPAPFRKEVDHVELYLDLEKRRFKENLDVVFDIRDTAFPIPPLTLQMIVENAVRHGVTMREEGGTVTISSKEVEGGHLVVVEDDGVGFDTSVPLEESHPHNGLALCRKRLQAEVRGTLTVTSEMGKGTRVEVFIPCYKAQMRIQ